MVYTLTAALQPFMPATADALCAQLGVITEDSHHHKGFLSTPLRFAPSLPTGHRIGKVGLS
jgi:methionyl-tRNA synthetase